MKLQLLIAAALLSAAPCLHAQTPVLLSDINPGTADAFDEFNSGGAQLGSRIFVTANDGAKGYELYTIENNQIGLFLDINPGAAGSTPEQLTVAGGKLFFTADDGINGKELWMSDGTVAGTQMVIDLAAGGGGSNLAGLIAGGDGRVYFSYNGKCYASDGTAAGTVVMSGASNINLTPSWQYASNLAVAYGDGLAFAGKNYDIVQVWISSGNQATKVLEYNATSFSKVFGFAKVKNGFIFSIYDDFAPQLTGLFYYNKTSNMVTKLSATLYAIRILPFNDEKAVLYTNSGYYVTDGTQPVLLTTAKPQLYQGQALPYVTVNNKLIMPGGEPLFSEDILVTDGTPAGTKTLFTIGQSFFASPWIVSGASAFIVGGTSNSFNAEIWQTDGSTVSSKKLYTYPNGSGINAIIPVGAIGNQFFYNSTLGGIGREMYRLQFNPITGVDDPALQTGAYQLRYNRLTSQVAIEGNEDVEPIVVDCFDLTGRLLQTVRTQTGVYFQAPEGMMAKVYCVKGGAGRQSFLRVD
jgi:ELWxxDGT repeat protein